MSFTPNKFNRFMMLRLPSAWLCGVRLKELTSTFCRVGVKHRWINQNPFKSMFWAVQGMAAELSTGALIMSKISTSGRRISMLVTNNTANFSKKATGRISFSCEDGLLLDQAIAKAIETGEGQTVWMKSVGSNQDGVVVSTFNFEWSLRLKG